MTIHFTSDQHYGHTNIIEVCKRPFGNTEQMTEGLIRRHNAVVQPTDSVYMLGDLFWMNANKAIPIMERLNGKKYWVRGNHDSKDHVKKLGDFFEWVKDYHEEKFSMPWMDEDGEQKEHVQHVVMCHYPIYSWNKMAYGAWMLHGHCHGNLGEQNTLRYDVGVDWNDMSPVTLEAIAKKLALKTVTPVDHHVPS